MSRQKKSNTERNRERRRKGRAFLPYQVMTTRVATEIYEDRVARNKARRQEKRRKEMEKKLELLRLLQSQLPMITMPREEESLIVTPEEEDLIITP